jgi:hypothetical protein
MTEHLPTFRPSGEHKIKIKPAGWITIAIVAMILISLVALGLNALAGRGQIEPLSEAGSADTGSAAQQEAVAVWWQSRLRTVEDPVTGSAYLVAPDSVVQQVIENYQQETPKGRADLAYEVKDFSPDGLECTLGVLEGEVSVLFYRIGYSPATQEWASIEMLQGITLVADAGA